MIDGLSLGTLGIGSGWAIVALGVIMIFRGDLITKREARGLERRADAAVGRLDLKDKTIAEFASVVGTSNAMIKAVLDVAEQRNEERTP